MPDKIQLEHLTDREILMLTAQTLNDLCTTVHVQNGRIRTLEDWRNFMLGAMGVITVIVPIATAWIVSLIGGGK